MFAKQGLGMTGRQVWTERSDLLQMAQPMADKGGAILHT
jgi:hypothetical protein